MLENLNGLSLFIDCAGADHERRGPNYPFIPFMEWHQVR